MNEERADVTLSREEVRRELDLWLPWRQTEESLDAIMGLRKLIDDRLRAGSGSR